MAIDWRKRRPLLGNVVGGLSGPAIKPIALRCVYQAAGAVDIPIVGIGGIAGIDDLAERRSEVRYTLLGETGRMIGLMIHTLEEAGVERPADHLIVISSRGFLPVSVATTIMTEPPSCALPPRDGSMMANLPRWCVW